MTFQDQVQYVIIDKKIEMYFSLQNNDLHALTGWIPERIDLKDCDKEKIFRMMESKFKTGLLLIN